MRLLKLKIDKIIIHQVYQRDAEGRRVKPMQIREYTRFDPEAMETFKQRIFEALGESSKAVEMEIVKQEENDVSFLVNRSIDEDDATFAVSSYDFAVKLSDSQLSKGIPGGIVVVFTGTHGRSANRFLGIIKAETHSAYEAKKDKFTGEISLEFVKQVLLTPSSKLYKTAAFFEKTDFDGKSKDLNDKWLVMVSDTQISKADGKAAAKYFYDSFLGFGYPQTSARTTQQFYEKTKKFIKGLEIEEFKKNDYFNALNTYLKVDTSSTISTADFASKYFDQDTQEEFSEYMDDAGIPTASFTKDIEFISSSLKFRKVSFSKNIKISAPSDSFKHLISMSTIDGDIGKSGVPEEWTQVIIKDKIVKQE
ncbi:MAG TPA: hypothetical protein ENH88_14950 [Pseudoalteromonas prydzensis]|uniref:Nucleoid-associated protein n=2 Tax=root TaxID=1 RepID=A0A7V1GFQ9_9GAMM|nr:nucleoid-associated protein [Pseudoalteromonas prydzensis]HEA17707.1 hypothetical protein [Pseudoalteromonas prydzensis]